MVTSGCGPENERTVMGMAEYIEREALMRRIKEIHCAECDSYHGVKCRACWVDDTLDYIDCEPAADVAKGRHGNWCWEGRFRACSICGSYVEFTETLGASHWKYCPYCGAKMDGNMENYRQAEVIR